MKDAPDPAPKPAAPLPGLRQGDYYYDGPYLVFTERYHLRRGWCCGSGCRHCPYGKAPAAKSPTQP